MTDDEMQRLAAMIADKVCQRASDEIKLICLWFIYVVIAFWFIKMAIAFWKFWWIDEERSA